MPLIPLGIAVVVLVVVVFWFFGARPDSENNVGLETTSTTTTDFQTNNDTPVSTQTLPTVESAPEAGRGDELLSTPPSNSLTPLTPPTETSAARAFSITGTPGHQASGQVIVSDTSVRFENYRGTRGPDLFVYLTNDLEDASDFVNLGRTQGTSGTFEYRVPADVDVETYKYVVTWCQQFGVLFDYATIR